MQNKLLKLRLKLGIRTRTNTVYKMLNILKIEDIRKTKMLALWILVLWKNVLQYLNSIMLSKSIQYHTRQVGDLDVPSSRAGYGDRSLKVDGAKKWNNMDANMKL